MIKTLAVFQSQCALNSREPLEALTHGLRRHGVRVLLDSMDADAVLLWSVLWAGRMVNNQRVYDGYRALNRPVMIMDVGSLLRNVTWKVAVDHINAQGYYGHHENLDPARPARLGLKLRDPQPNNGKILLACQHSRSLQMQQWPDTQTWVQHQIEQLRRYTDRPIVVRPHPRDRVSLTHLPPGVEMEIPRKQPNTYDSFDLGFDWHALVNHNSGPGIQAAIAGCRPVVDATSLAHPVAVDHRHIERAYLVDRSQWFLEICHTEWTVAELDQGHWVDRLKDRLDG